MVAISHYNHCACRHKYSDIPHAQISVDTAEVNSTRQHHFPICKAVSQLPSCLQRTRLSLSGNSEQQGVELSQWLALAAHFLLNNRKM